MEHRGLDRPRWLQLLQELAERNAVLELLSGHVDDDAAAERWRVRLLGCARGVIVVQRPRQAVGDRRLRRGDPITLIASHSGMRWLMHGNVLKSQRYPINSRIVVPATVLAMAGQVQRAQRRDSYRVGIAGMDTDPVRLWPAGGGTVVEARLWHVGAGGIDVLVPHQQVPWSVGMRLEVSLRLPLTEGTVDTTGRITRLTRRDRGDWHVGMAFEYCSAPQRERAQQTLLRFSALIQRQHLRRRRRLPRQARTVESSRTRNDFIPPQPSPATAPGPRRAGRRRGWRRG